jgi:hypothetical protein
MIKDYGGFQKLVMSATPKMKFVDLDAQVIFTEFFLVQA